MVAGEFDLHAVTHVQPNELDPMKMVRLEGYLALIMRQDNAGVSMRKQIDNTAAMRHFGDEIAFVGHERERCNSHSNAERAIQRLTSDLAIARSLLTPIAVKLITLDG
jgi:hypothetical protein